jgi:hypothetical protein
MKLSIALLLSTMICSLTPANATARSRAQGCRLDLTPHYSAYANESTDGTYIYTSVLVDGYADFTPSAGCTGNGAVHTPYAYNVIGSTGGWRSGTSGCMTCYYSYENDQSLVASPGTTYPFNWDGEMNCTVFGTFWSISGSVGIKIVLSSFGLQFQNATSCEYFQTCQGTCRLNGRHSFPSTWGGVCPSFLLCFDLYVSPKPGCVFGICRAKTFDRIYAHEVRPLSALG